MVVCHACEHRSVLAQAMKRDQALSRALNDLNDLSQRYSGDGDKGMAYLREAAPFLRELCGDLGTRSAWRRPSPCI